MIKVNVIDYGRKFLQLQYVDRTGRRVTKSSKCTNRRDAHRAATKLEKELNGDGASEDGSIAWGDFCAVYRVEHVEGLADNTGTVINSTIKAFEKIAAPEILRDVNARALSQFVARRRAAEISPNTIAKDLRHLRHALGWAVARKYLPAIPVFPTVARTRKGSDMKGRPITDAEFARMIQAVPAVVGSHRAESFEHMIRGLWLSGLRLSEAASLRWTPGDWPSLIVENPRRPAIRFPDGGQKSGEAQVAPLTPDFGEFIARAEDRSGRVFRPLSPTGKPLTAVSEISRTISAIGKSAKVIVDETTKKPASAHDLRRSFGTRWAARVMPAILKDLMRHKSIEITLRYYVGQDLDRTHDAILRAMDTTLSTTPAETHVDAK